MNRQMAYRDTDLDLTPRERVKVIAGAVLLTLAFFVLLFLLSLA